MGNIEIPGSRIYLFLYPTEPAQREPAKASAIFVENALAAARETRTFADLADFYKEKYIIPPVYVGTKKVAGLRSYECVERQLNNLLDYFSSHTLSAITYEDIEGYKFERLNTPIVYTKRAGLDSPVVTTKERSVATVHRDLALLRHMLNVAVRKQWIIVNPFAQGDPLIIASHENERMSIMTHDQEDELLAWSEKSERRRNLAPALIFSLETAMRENEQFSLTPADVSLKEGIITVREMITKTMRRRIVPITERLRPILQELIKRTRSDKERHFTVDSVRTAFVNGCDACGILDYRWHDNRHTAIMRMLEAGMDSAEVMKITGHREWRTFMRYVALNAERARELAGKMDKRRASREKEKKKQAAPVVPLRPRTAPDSARRSTRSSIGRSPGSR